MLPTKSPGGSMFPYFYKNGQLYCLHLGSYGADEDGVVALIQAEEAFLLGQHRSIPIWADLYETRLTPRIQRALVGFLEHTHPRIPRLALVGCRLLDRWRFKRLLRQAACLSALPVRFFADPEAAKTWLVSDFRER